MSDKEKLLPSEIFGAYTHVGIVVKDIDAYCEKLTTIFGYELGGTGMTPQDPSRMYKGEPEDFACKMAFFYPGGTCIELLMPIKGRNVWQDALDETGDGLHHLNYDVAEYDAAIAHLEAHGMKVVQSGLQSRRPGHRWCYVDAREQLGMYLEIAEGDKA